MERSFFARVHLTIKISFVTTHTLEAIGPFFPLFTRMLWGVLESALVSFVHCTHFVAWNEKLVLERLLLTSCLLSCFVKKETVHLLKTDYHD